MKIRLRFVAFVILCLCLFCPRVWAFWIWTPETKTWTNPKNAPKESPQEQLKFAKGYFEAKDYTTALREFKKLVKYFSDAVEAPEAQFYTGRCLEELGQYYDAFGAYQKIIDKYPFSMRTDDVLERQYIVAQKLLDYRKSFIGIDFTGENAAIEVFRKIVENSPYGRFAAASQYKVGLTLKAKGEYAQAVEEFQSVVDNYPSSEWAEPAKFQIALCASQSSLASSYDQTMTQEAKDQFSEFVRTHPDAELTQQAQGQISDLEDREAQALYDVAQFYQKQKTLDSARIYYKNLISTYPDSAWAEKARQQLEELERKAKP